MSSASTSEKRKEGCAKCLELFGKSLENHYRNYHQDLTLNRTMEDDTLKSVVVQISRKRRCIEQDQDLEGADGSRTAKRTKASIRSNISFSSHILNGPYARTFSKRSYFELSEEICALLNKCWFDSPSMKYFSAKALAGAILYQPDTNEALLINTVEIYGRNSLMDPHFERSRLSYPPKDIKYPNVWPVSTSTPDGLKLIIGTNICNYLVTSSIRIDKKVEPEVGPSTNAFVLDTTDKCNKVQIYLDRRMYQRAKELGKDANCTGIEPSNSHYQLRQLCSEFDELETYAKMKASFDLLNFLDDQPVTIYTLAAHPKALPSEDQDGASDDIVASRLFFNIASEVIGRNYNARLEKEMVISLLFRFKDPNQQIPKLFKEIISLYGENEEYIHIISNDALNRKLVQLAGKLASYITKANKDIIENIKAVFDYN